MTIEEIKNAIEQKTGIPAALLHGSTEAEIFSYAKQLAEFKGGAAPRAPAAGSAGAPGAAPKTTREQWADYCADIGIGSPRPPESMTDRVDAAMKEICPDYPALQDGGELPHQYKAPSTGEQFGEWFSSVFGYHNAW